MSFKCSYYHSSQLRLKKKMHILKTLNIKQHFSCSIHLPGKMLVRQLKFSWRTSLLQLTTFIHKNSHEMAIIDKLKQGNTIAVLISFIL